MKTEKRGFTLTEILIVVLIIGLVAALILPILTSSKERAVATSCISNLRQVHVAWSLYIGQASGTWPTSLDEFIPTNSGEMLTCPTDHSYGANLKETERTGRKTSYFYIWPLADYRSDLKQADPNHGIAYCVLHGEVEAGKAGDGFDAELDTNGRVLRLRQDGSVKSVDVGHYCLGDVHRRGQIRSRPQWTLLTDAPCPSRWCLGSPCEQERR